MTQVGWDSFKLTWIAPDNNYEKFVIRVQELEDGEEPQTIVVPGELRSLEVPGLKPATKYNITLHGVIRGLDTVPLSGEVLTGTICWNASQSPWEGGRGGSLLHLLPTKLFT